MLGFYIHRKGKICYRNKIVLRFYDKSTFSSKFPIIEYQLLKENGMKIFKYPAKSAEKRISAIINRTLEFKKKDFVEISRIVEDVRKNGDKALLHYTRKFDAPRLAAASIKVKP